MRFFDRRHLNKHFMWLCVALGAAACLFALFNISTERIDLRFLLLAFVTITLSSRIYVQIPRITSQISVSDTFIFLTVLLYDGEAAILLAAIEAFSTTLRFSKRPRILLFNSGVAAFSTFLSVLMIRLLFGSITELPHGAYSSNFITALGVMALVQYISNSGSVAFAVALKNRLPIWQTWTKNYLWTSITYFTGASAAGVIAKLVGTVGVYALVVMTPIVAIVFFTYRTYLKNVESAAAQAEQAERHVVELNRYIAEQEMIREQFSQIEKLSALGELASGVAHDFNNTLAGILGRAQLMMRTNDPEKLKRGLEIIIKSAEDGAKTVKRIQDFARQRRDHDFALLNVDQLLLDVGEITRPRWKDCAEASNIHIQLELHVHSNALIMGDDSELREVLVNMVFNAVDAMPAGGTLTLSAAEQDGIIEIAVGDTGSGMSEEVRSRIFDPFFTTKGKAGLGLGLAVSYGIIRRHEGTVEVESEVDRGTTFKIRLPLAKSLGEADYQDRASELLVTDSAVAAVPPLTQINQARILVVDDEMEVRELLRDILEGEGCTATLAESGQRALALFDSGKFDAVFTDIGMPEMSGWELAHAVRERDGQVALAVITGWGEAVGSSEQREAKVDWVVTKPFDISRIAELAWEVTKRRNDALKLTPLTVAA
jgi:signal transduction histidine kinase/ActR/RegA family two-component response regulator